MKDKVVDNSWKSCLGVILLAVISGFIAWRFVEKLFFSPIIALLTASVFGFFTAVYIILLAEGPRRKPPDFLVEAIAYLIGLSLFFVLCGLIAQGVDDRIEKKIAPLVEAQFITVVCDEALLMPVLPFSGPIGRVWLHGEDYGDYDIGFRLHWPRAHSVDQINTLLCFVSEDIVHGHCSYSLGGISAPDFPSSTVQRIQFRWRVVAVDWETQQVRGHKIFTGSEPSPCREKVSSGDADDPQHGSMPMKELRNWLADLEHENAGIYEDTNKP